MSTKIGLLKTLKKIYWEQFMLTRAKSARQYRAVRLLTPGSPGKVCVCTIGPALTLEIRAVRNGEGMGGQGE